MRSRRLLPHEKGHMSVRPKPPPQAEKPPTLSTKEKLFVALWRFKREVEHLDFHQIEMSANDTAEARYTWGQILVSLRIGLGATKEPTPFRHGSTAISDAVAAGVTATEAEPVT